MKDVRNRIPACSLKWFRSFATVEQLLIQMILREPAHYGQVLSKKQHDDRMIVFEMGILYVDLW